MNTKETIVITGLAQGMGREVAKLLAKAGDTVAGFDVDEEGLKSLEKELTEFGGDHLLQVIDITNRAKILKFRDEVLAKYGHVDTVLSNVGIGFFDPFEEVNLEKALKCFEINVIGFAAIFQAFIPSMRQNKKGKLVAMSSLVGRIPFPFESIYTGTKHAIEGMVQSIRLEVAPFGIQCAIIEPAQVSTTFAAKIHHLPPENSPYRERAKRFIERDVELVKTAVTPIDAAKKIFTVIKAKKPKLYNPVDSKSALFLGLNKILPKNAKDSILLGYMKIKP